ncbi:hypothetical protein [Inconstantimicrobium mannanitabidum]|uniref:Uncharacterized protein n=1 Tax=Inconstantimicrobium mannanitabidum TaxID=1604901 RepID=A0ACB5RGL9_9CLOT|nr:hypothetical protein [Clostridium sp. TW13]GKX68212.1 hypothetical protein rsdtw13_34700 [Clostridium sp. TW13]
MKILKVIDKILRSLVYAMCTIGLILFVLFSLSFSNFRFERIFTELGLISMIFAFIFYFFIKNKSGKNKNTLIIFALGIVIIIIRFKFFNSRRYFEKTFIQSIFSTESLFDLVPLSLIYLSTICTYFVSKKKYKELTQDKN